MVRGGEGVRRQGSVAGKRSGEGPNEHEGWLDQKGRGGGGHAQKSVGGGLHVFLYPCGGIGGSNLHPHHIRDAECLLASFLTSTLINQN